MSDDKHLENEIDDLLDENASEDRSEATNDNRNDVETTQNVDEIKDDKTQGDQHDEKTSHSSKKKLFHKKDKENAELKKKDEEIAQLQDKYTRQLAEFDNFRRRNEAEKSKMYDVGAKAVIEKLLPIVDNFERGLSSLTDEEMEHSFAKGMDQVYKQLMTTFDELGVEAIKALGENFNPEVHNAVMHVEDENYGENVVVEEMMKGYKYKDSVVRYSMVKVAN